MNIIFRCNHCETLNEISTEFRYRLCKKCSAIVTYVLGESIICNDDNDCYGFINENNLSMEKAEDFFKLADTYYEQISIIIRKHEEKSFTLLDIPATSQANTVLLLLEKNKSETLDELIENCRLFDIDLEKLEQFIRRMKNEGMIYHPKGWLIRLI